MKNLATLLLLVGFAGMAVFGLFVMDFAMGHDGGGCVASRLNGNDNLCPMNLMQMAFHHVSAFQAFSLSTSAFSFTLGLIFLLSFLSLSLLFIKILSFRPPIFLGRLQRGIPEPSLFQQQKIIRWLALFEHSPSII
jgi:hypothetical protein